MDNIENNILKVLNEEKEIIEEVSLKDVGKFISDVTSSSSDIVNSYTEKKINGFFNNKTVESILYKMISKMITTLILSNPELLQLITNSVLDNIKINVEKK
jgi:hypothetical protein